jgi:hypothetical protein
VKRTANWDKTTIRRSDKSVTSDVNQTSVPGTTSQWNFSTGDIDITEMLKSVTCTNMNFDFCLTLQNETIYRKEN